MPRLLALFIALIALTCPALAKTEWLHARSEHFEVFSSAGKGYTEELIRNLENIQYVFNNLYAQKPQYQVKVLVIYCGNDKDMRPFLKVYQGKPVDMAGMYLGPVDYPALVMEDGWTGESTRQVIYHEMGHVLIEALIPDPPLWFNEGFAETFETIELDKKGFTLGMPSSDVVEILRTSGLMPMEQLINAQHSSRFYNEGAKRDIFYAQSWAFVHMCNFSRDTTLRNKLFAYVVAERTESDKVACMERIFGCSLDTLDRHLSEYIRTGSFSMPHGKFPADRTVAVEYLPCKPGELEAARLSVIQRVHHNDDDSNAMISAFRSLADGDNGFLCSMASLQCRNINEKELAQTLGDRAIELSADHPKILLNKILDETTQMPHTVTYRMPEDVAEHLRGLIDKAMVLYPGNVDLLKQLAYVEAFAPKVRREKLKLLESVVRIVSDRDDILLMLSYIRWHYGDMETARQLLANVSGKGQHKGGIEDELNFYLGAGKPWKKFL